MIKLMPGSNSGLEKLTKGKTKRPWNIGYKCGFV